MLRSLYAVRSICKASAGVNRHLIVIPSAIRRRGVVERDDLASSSRDIHFTTAMAGFADSHEEIDKSLLRLDHEIRRKGRVARQEIDELLQDIRDMRKATSNQSLMMIRCCGELVPSETPENRTKLVQEVWKTMEMLNVPFDISHYNALLRVYLENEEKFNPTEFLQELSNKGLEPNRVTFQRLIARYCQEGDIDGATTILQHMKEKQFPINENVINALIEGHSIADDMESAEGMIPVMQQAGLEPNDDTYVKLMCGYARKGDMDNIHRIVRECGERKVFFIDKDFLDVIYTLIANGHENLVESVLPLLKKRTGFNQDATNLVVRLVSIGQLDMAYRILKEMSKIVWNDEVQPSGNFFLQHLVKTSEPDQIIRFCKMMMADEVHSHALSKACDIALQIQQFDKVFDLLDAYKETGAQIRQHFFWPIFAGSRSEKNVFDGLKNMRYLEVPPSLETLRDYVIPALFKKSQGSPAQILEKLGSHTGSPLVVLVPAVMQYLLSERNIDRAIQFAQQFRLRFSNAQLRKAIADSYFRDRNAQTFVQIIGTASMDGEDIAREAAGHMVLDILERCRDKAEFILPIFKELLKRGIGLSNSGGEMIRIRLGDELTPELEHFIAQLTSGALSPKPEMYAPNRKILPQQLEGKSVSELEALHEEAVISGKPTRRLKKALLLAYFRKKDLEKAHAIRQELAAYDELLRQTLG